MLAILGDILGFKYGKRRISIFGLRPKYTSRLITSITGALIAIGVLGVMSVFSQDVRTALFGMKYIQQQIYDLQLQLRQSEENATQTRVYLAEASSSLDLVGFELDSMRNDKLILEQEKNELEATLMVMREESAQLKRDLRSMRSEAIALSANVLLGQIAFEPSSSREEILNGMNLLKQRARLNVLIRISNQTFSGLRDIPIEFDPNEEKNLVEKLISADERYYVRALSSENYTFDRNTTVKIKLESGPSIIIYPDGGIVYRKFFLNDNEGLSSEEILHVFLRDLRKNVIEEGIIPEPSTGNVGTLNGEAFFAAVEDLREIESSVIINAIASGDIYTEGPVNIEIVFETEE